MADDSDDALVPGLARIDNILAEGIERAARPRFAGIPPADELWWAEPCAGSGNLLRLMPTDRRIGFDILPQDQGKLGIVQADYLTMRLDPDKTWIALTNPPFSKGGPQAFFQWAANQPCVCAIGIIAPHYFDRPTTVNKLNPWFHRIHHEVLDPASFIHNGQKKMVARDLFVVGAARLPARPHHLADRALGLAMVACFAHGRSLGLDTELGHGCRRSQAPGPSRAHQRPG